MLFFNALVIGLISFVLVMCLKRVFFHKRPTPPLIMLCLVVSVTVTYVFGMGVLGKQWDIAIAYLLSTYIGIGFAQYESRDIAHNLTMTQQQTITTDTYIGPEDNPNWPRK